jgi:hypothetical protein
MGDASWGIERRKFKVNAMRFLPKDHRISSSGMMIDKLHKKCITSHRHIPDGRWQTTLGADLLEGRLSFPEA